MLNYFNPYVQSYPSRNGRFKTKDELSDCAVARQHLVAVYNSKPVCALNCHLRKKTKTSQTPKTTPEVPDHFLSSRVISIAELWPECENSVLSISYFFCSNRPVSKLSIKYYLFQRTVWRELSCNRNSITHHLNMLFKQQNILQMSWSLLYISSGFSCFENIDFWLNHYKKFPVIWKSPVWNWRIGCSPRPAWEYL